MANEIECDCTCGNNTMLIKTKFKGMVTYVPCSECTEEEKQAFIENAPPNEEYEEYQGECSTCGAPLEKRIVIG